VLEVDQLGAQRTVSYGEPAGVVVPAGEGVVEPGLGAGEHVGVVVPGVVVLGVVVTEVVVVTGVAVVTGVVVAPGVVVLPAAVPAVHDPTVGVGIGVVSVVTVGVPTTPPPPAAVPSPVEGSVVAIVVVSVRPGAGAVMTGVVTGFTVTATRVVVLLLDACFADFFSAIAFRAARWASRARSAEALRCLPAEVTIVVPAIGAPRRC